MRERLLDAPRPVRHRPCRARAGQRCRRRRAARRCCAAQPTSTRVLARAAPRSARRCGTGGCDRRLCRTARAGGRIGDDRGGRVPVRRRRRARRDGRRRRRRGGRGPDGRRRRRPAAHLRRALHWRRYGRGPVNAPAPPLRGRHRRGSLRLLRRARGDRRRPAATRRRDAWWPGSIRAELAGRGEPRRRARHRAVAVGCDRPDRGAAGTAARAQFVEADEIGPADAPAAVVFVVSAVAPIDRIGLCAHRSRGRAHRSGGRGGVEDRRAPQLARRAGRGPRRGSPHAPSATAMCRGSAWPRRPISASRDVDELVDLLRSRLDDADVRRRNRLRAWESRLQTVISRYDEDGAGADRQARVTALRGRRDPFCVSAGCPSPSAPSHCAARFSRPACSWRISRATAARRCAPNCRRTRRR